MLGSARETQLWLTVGGRRLLPLLSPSDAAAVGGPVVPVLLLVLDQNLAQQLLRGGEGLPRLQLTPTHKRELSHRRLPWMLCVRPELPTGYFSSGSMTRASPKMVRQYSAILACCLDLVDREGTRHRKARYPRRRRWRRLTNRRGFRKKG